MVKFIMKIAELKKQVLKLLTNRTFLLSLLLAVATAAVFLPVCRSGFVNYDDNYFVVQNPHIRQGITLEGLKWALGAGLFSGTGGYVDYWQPVTVISRMLDMQLYGLNPAGHHLTSLLLHVFNVLLLFLILRKTTGAVYRSALAAAVFGIHPVQVEAVAWVTARKDVLSMFFGLLTVWAYAGYAGKPGVKRGAVVFLLFALALMSKPMFVTLPFVLLLLDYWPLSRTRGAGGAGRWRIWARLIAEKTPLFVLSVCSVWLAFKSRSADLLHQPLSLRLSNALVFDVSYIFRWLFPRHLALWYPYPGADPNAPPFALWQVVAAAVLLVVILAVVLKFSKRQPFLAVGWLWYLGTLTPVILLRPHDRFLYLPSVGLAVLAAWGISALGEKLRTGKKVRAACAIFILLILAALAFVQTGRWKDSETLFRHSLAVVRNNPAMENRLGAALAIQGRYQEALPHYQEAVRMDPLCDFFHTDLGLVLVMLNQPQEAERHFREAVRLDPAGSFTPYKNLAALLKKQGRFRESEQCLARARKNMLPALPRDLRRGPDRVETLSDLAALLAETGSGREAAVYYEKVLQINPDSLPALKALAVARVRSPGSQNTIRYFNEIIRLSPGDAKAHYNLGYALASRDLYDEAIGHYQKAVSLDPNYLQAYFNLGNCYAKLGRFEEAAAAYEKALALDPAGEKIHYNMGLVLEKLGNTDEAGRHYAEALRINPASEAARKNPAAIDRPVPDASQGPGSGKGL